MILQPRHKDRRICSRCGAPAELIGKAWVKDGVLDWYVQPVESRVPDDVHSPRHAQRRTRKRSVGRGFEVEEYAVQVFTHLCTRVPGTTAAGEPTDDLKLLYECGALMVQDTRQVGTHELPASCFFEPEVAE